MSNCQLTCHDWFGELLAIIRSGCFLNRTSSRNSRLLLFPEVFSFKLGKRSFCSNRSTSADTFGKAQWINYTVGLILSNTNMMVNLIFVWLDKVAIFIFIKFLASWWPYFIFCRVGPWHQFPIALDKYLKLLTSKRFFLQCCLCGLFWRIQHSWHAYHIHVSCLC